MSAETLNEEKVLEYILSLDHYPRWTEVILAFGDEGVERADQILSVLRSRGDIVVDGDGEILVTKATNERLKEMLRRAVRVR